MTELTAMTKATTPTAMRQADPVAQSGLIAGFDDPMTGAQSTFRVMLEALSHPGRRVRLDTAATQTGVPAGLSFAMTAMLLTLVDSDTALWLPPGIPEATRQFLRFHCGCPLVETLADARFVAIPTGYDVPPMSGCNQGDPAWPDRSATLLIAVEALRAPEEATPASTVSLSGPGIEHTQGLSVIGLPEDFWLQWRRHHTSFPLGVDVFFCCNDTVCGLPRTTRVEN